MLKLHRITGRFRYKRDGGRKGKKASIMKKKIHGVVFSDFGKGITQGSIRSIHKKSLSLSLKITAEIYFLLAKNITVFPTNVDRSSKRIVLYAYRGKICFFSSKISALL